MTLTTPILRFIVDDVMEKVQSDFINAGIDEAVLHDLRTMWLQRIVRSGVVAHEVPLLGEEAISAETVDPNHQYLNAAQIAPESIMGFYTKSQQPVPMGSAAPVPSGSVPRSGLPLGYYAPGNPHPSAKAVHPSVLMQKPGGGQGPSPMGKVPIPPASSASSSGQSQPVAPRPVLPQKPQMISKNAHHFKQLDGTFDNELADEEEDEDEEDDDDNETVEETSRQRQSKVNISGTGGDEDDDELGSDLDDEEEDDETGAETINRVLCQYEKVTRTKNKWKGQLKDGVVHVNGRDIFFQKAQCDFEF